MNNRLLHLKNRLYGDVQPADGDIDLPCDLQGWGSRHRYFEELIATRKPQVIVEIGVWKGGSTIHMAKLLKKHNIDGCVVAVDTWLGSSEHWLSERWRPDLKLINGYPSIFRQFIANCRHEGVMENVLPLPLDSTNASIVLQRFGVKVDLLHIDAGHDYHSVTNDLENWFPLLAEQGALICDDYRTDGGWPEVKAAVDSFAIRKKLKLALVDQPKCVIFR